MRAVLGGAVALVLFAAAAAPAAAQSDANSWAACNGEDEDFTRAAQISGCTAVIDSGRYSGNQLAIAYYNRGIVYYRNEDYPRAIADFTAAMRHNPEDARFYNNRGNAYYNQRDYPRALADFSEAVRLDPRHAVAFRNRGDTYDEMGDYPRAIADYDEAIRLNPRDGRAFALRGYTNAVRLNDQAAGIADYDEAIRLNPRDAATYNNRGRAHYRLREFDRAIDDFSAAIRIDPQYALAYRNRGDTYDEDGDYDRAIADFDQAIRLNPRDAEAYALRGITYRRLKDYPRSVADFRASLRIEPSPERWDGLCWTLALEGRDLAAARTACDSGLAIEANHASLLDSRALVGLKQRRFQDAWNDYDAAARADRNGQARYIYGRGLAAIGLGRTADGEADLARAKKLQPRVGELFRDLGVGP